MDMELPDEPLLMEDEQAPADAEAGALSHSHSQSGAFSLRGAAEGGGDDAKRWLQSLERSIRAIASIRLLSVRAFDGNGASFSVATGFIVDLRRGIILTNRHVVTPGPVVADAIFMNKEEVDLVPIYRCRVALVLSAERILQECV